VPGRVACCFLSYWFQLDKEQTKNRNAVAGGWKMDSPPPLYW